MNITELIIEVTRRCNMECGHCMRGDAQNKDISRETLAKLLEGNDIESISTVTFTGGEPSLNVQAIRDFMDICKAQGIDVGSFYIATNGKRVPDEFFHVLIDLYLFCSDNEFSSVMVSRSQWHEEEGQDEDAIKRLETLRFVGQRKRLEYSVSKQYKSLISEGRAAENMYEGREITPKDHIDPDELSVYVNVHGDIIPDCDLSYESQERAKLGNVYHNKLEEFIPVEEEA